MSKYIFRNELGGYESAYDKNSLMRLCYEEIADLEAKLAEKDKEIADIKDSCDYYMSRANDLLIKNQDKIEFAVEQLEKVKDAVNGFYGEYSASVITNIIDNQIKQLKEGNV